MSSAQSLQRFVFEGTELVRKVLITYTDTMMLVSPGLAVASFEYLTQSTARRILHRTT